MRAIASAAPDSLLLFLLLRSNSNNARHHSSRCTALPLMISDFPHLDVKQAALGDGDKSVILAPVAAEPECGDGVGYGMYTQQQLVIIHTDFACKQRRVAQDKTELAPGVSIYGGR